MILRLFFILTLMSESLVAMPPYYQQLSYYSDYRPGYTYYGYSHYPLTAVQPLSNRVAYLATPVYSPNYSIPLAPVSPFFNSVPPVYWGCATPSPSASGECALPVPNLSPVYFTPPAVRPAPRAVFFPTTPPLTKTESSVPPFSDSEDTLEETAPQSSKSNLKVNDEPYPEFKPEHLKPTTDWGGEKCILFPYVTNALTNN